MIIKKVDPARKSFGDYALDGTALTVGNLTVDLAAEEKDQWVLILFCQCNGMVHRGLMDMPGCRYVAEASIPPRRYETVEVDGPPEGWDGDGEPPETHQERVAVPLDVNAVVLKAWPVEGGRNGD